MLNDSHKLTGPADGTSVCTLANGTYICSVCEALNALVGKGGPAEQTRFLCINFAVFPRSRTS